MGRGVHYIGTIGVIVFLFGLLLWSLVQYDEYLLIPTHLIIGGILMIIFVVRGGLGYLSAAAAKRTAGFGIGLLVYSGLFLGLLGVLNYLAFRHEFFRYDSTTEKVFTLSPESVEVLRSLKQPVMVRAFYLGGKLESEVEALLERFAKLSEHFRWKVIDPEKSPQEMEKYGISQTATLHFSFEAPDSKREAKIAREINEQEISNALLKLTRGGEKKIYILAGHGEADFTDAGEGGFLFIKEAIQGENILIESLSLGEQRDVPKDAAALLVLAPKKELLSTEVSAIERYLQGGGNALFALEPRTSSELVKFLRPLGVLVGNDIIIEQVVEMFAGPRLGVRPQVTNYGIHPITNDFSGSTVFSTARSVMKAATIPEGTTVTELALTSANSWAERNIEQVFSDEPSAMIDPDDLKGPVSVAATFEGVFPTAHARPVASDGAATGESSSDDKKPCRIVVLGDIDFVANIDLRRVFNTDFFLNSLNWVIGQDRVIKIAPKSLKGSIETLSQDQFNLMFLLSGIIFPEIVLIIGMSVWWSRRR